MKLQGLKFGDNEVHQKYHGKCKAMIAAFMA